jgi:hypothetical protein
MNFWRQKGVYVLYDRDLTPVYAGQAGLERSNSTGGRTIGDRLVDHSLGKYRNGWEFFSWFGFLKSEREHELKGKLKRAARELRHDPDWSFSIAPDETSELNALLDSFEAILIEAFVPRFNSRGRNLKGATYVDQLEVKPKLVIEAEAQRSVPEQEH